MLINSTGSWKSWNELEMFSLSWCILDYEILEIALLIFMFMLIQLAGRYRFFFSWKVYSELFYLICRQCFSVQVVNIIRIYECLYVSQLNQRIFVFFHFASVNVNPITVVCHNQVSSQTYSLDANLCLLRLYQVSRCFSCDKNGPKPNPAGEGPFRYFLAR